MIASQGVDTVLASRSPLAVRGGVRGRSAYFPIVTQPQERVLDEADEPDPEILPVFSGGHKRRTTKARKKSKKKSNGKKKSKGHSHNVFDHTSGDAVDDGSTSSSFSDDSSETSSAGGDSQDAIYQRPDKNPLQPVFCGKPEPVQSALLVRMVGSPSLMTRYERLTVEQIVLDSYNDWMLGTCDGYHRMIDAVKLKPIDDLPVVSQVHKETLMLDQARIQGDESSEDDRPRQLVQAEDIFAENQPTPGPSSSYYGDNLQYRPLFWLSLSGTCRNCPKTDQGNSNLLASHAGRASPNSVVPDEISASDLVLEEVCMCPIKNATATRGISNATTMEHTTVERFFPEAKAPTSVDLLDLINQMIQDLQSSGSPLLQHVKALEQLTEPDYAYYALEMQGTNSYNATQDNNTVTPIVLLETAAPMPVPSNETDAPTVPSNETDAPKNDTTNPGVVTTTPSVSPEQASAPVKEPTVESHATRAIGFSQSALFLTSLYLVLSNGL